MLLHDHSGLTDEKRRMYQTLLDRHTTLERVVHWGFAQDPPVDVLDVLVQDEFTHDVIVPAPSLGVVLVYDST